MRTEGEQDGGGDYADKDDELNRAYSMGPNNNNYTGFN
jgi:hypothetical protein